MHRLYAALSFMLAGAIPGVFAILYDYAQYGGLFTPLSFLLILYILIPAILAGISGFVFGAAIFDPEKVNSAPRAAGRGLFVSLVAWAAYAPILSGWIGQAVNMSFLQKLALVLIGGTFFVGWLIALAGVATGMLLFNLRKPTKTSNP